jgi:phosphoglycerate kinase
VSTKLELLGNLVGKVDQLIVGGGIANTFLAAQGLPVGKSLCEHELSTPRGRSWPTPRRAARRSRCPTDVVVAARFADDAPRARRGRAGRRRRPDPRHRPDDRRAATPS